MPGGVLTTTADFKATQNVQYQHGGDKAVFQLGVQANHNETPLHYEVTNAVDGNGNLIAPENISSELLTIAADGTVTPKGVGSAVITVSLPECNNYTATADTMTVQVNITKGDVVPLQVETAGTLTYGEPLSRLGFAKAVFVDADDNSVTINGQEYEYVFTPEDITCYEITTGKITITVNKAQYPPFMPGSNKNVARSCAKVSDVELPQGWEWDEGDSQTELTISTAVTAKANYIAADSANYENVSVSIEITRAGCEHTKTEIRKAATE